MSDPRDEPEHGRRDDLRRAVHDVFRAGLESVQPARLIPEALRLDGDVLVAPGFRHLLGAGRLLVVGCGKASGPMAVALERLVGPNRIAAGLVVTKAPSERRPVAVETISGGHPIPDAESATAGERLLRLAERAGEDDLVVGLISGGGSALALAPMAGLSVAEAARAVELLVDAGAPVAELNVVRKHLSKIGGGRLAAACRPARCLALVLSDTPDAHADATASGPMAPDRSTYAQALSVLERHGVIGETPPAVLRFLARGAAGREPETLAPGDPTFSRVCAVVLADPRSALAAMVPKARDEGMATLVLPGTVAGPAEEVAARLDAASRRLAGGYPRSCVLAAGEVSVRALPGGRGGRCQHLGALVLLRIADRPVTVFGAFASDGEDHLPGVGGSIVDDTALARAGTLGVDPRVAIDRRTTHELHTTLGTLVAGGPTGTNVADLYVLAHDATAGRRPPAYRALASPSHPIPTDN